MIDFSNKIISINQPAYLPWLGYFDRILRSDVHIVLDHVQFEKNSFVNRNKIRTKYGNTMLTVPVITKGRFRDIPVNSVEISCKSNWQKKHFKSICESYSKAPFFHNYSGFFEDIYLNSEWNSLSKLLFKVNEYLLDVLGIQTSIFYSSALRVSGEKSEMLLELCKLFSAGTYLSGPLGREYLDTKVFSENNIGVVFHDFVHPTYDQTYSGFKSHMSIIDLIFNYGPRSREILQSRSPL